MQAPLVRPLSGSSRRGLVVDVALSAAMLLTGQVALWAGGVDEGALGVTAPTYAALSLALLLRRGRPLLMSGVMAVVIVLQSVLAIPPTSIWALVLILIVGFSIGAHADRRSALIGLAILMAATYLDSWLTPGAPLGDRLFTAPVLCVGPWLAGRLVRRHSSQARRLDELNAELEQRRIEEVQAATAEERARIARELHDVVAHGISVMVIQAAAASQLLDLDPDRARDPLDQIRHTGKAALVDMRRLLGVLRTDDDGLARTPQPGLADLPDLAEAMRAAGLQVLLEMPEPPPPLSAGCDLAAYRIVQEALTNAVKHAGRVATTVRVQLVGERLDLEVTNDGGAPSPVGVPSGGHGLIGMRERAGLFGGSVEAGPHGAGWRVLARLPLEPADHR